jgi:hypothetical protein
MDKTLIAQTVANKLFATEDAVDKSIVEASKLLAGLVEARQEMRLSAVVGDDVVAKVAVALGALAEARKAVVEAHNELAEVKLRVGIRTKLIGVVDKSQLAASNDAVVGQRRAS